MAPAYYGNGACAVCQPLTEKPKTLLSSLMKLFSPVSRRRHSRHRNLGADNSPPLPFTILINMKWKNLSRIIFLVFVLGCLFRRSDAAVSAVTVLHTGGSPPHLAVTAQLSVEIFRISKTNLSSFCPPFCSTVADKWAEGRENRAEEHNLGVEGAVVPQQQPHRIRGQILREGKLLLWLMADQPYRFTLCSLS